MGDDGQPPRWPPRHDPPHVPAVRLRDGGRACPCRLHADREGRRVPQICPGPGAVRQHGGAPRARPHDRQLLEVLAVDYHEPDDRRGADAGLAMQSAMERFPNGRLAVIEGVVPKAGGGSSCLVGGRPFADVAREAIGAIATIALPSCAFDGSAPGANGGTTTPRSRRHRRLARRHAAGMPGERGQPLPPPSSTTSRQRPPPADMMGRPLAFYGERLSTSARAAAALRVRRQEFVSDEGAQKRLVPVQVGCKAQKRRQLPDGPLRRRSELERPGRATAARRRLAGRLCARGVPPARPRYLPFPNHRGHRRRGARGRCRAGRGGTRWRWPVQVPGPGRAVRALVLSMRLLPRARRPAPTIPPANPEGGA